MANVKVSFPQGGDSMDVEDGGSVTLGANVTITVSGTNVIITGLPTSNPSVAGALTLSAG